MDAIIAVAAAGSVGHFDRSTRGRSAGGVPARAVAPFSGGVASRGDDRVPCAHEFLHLSPTLRIGVGSGRPHSRLRPYAALIVETHHDLLFQALQATLGATREETVKRPGRRLGCPVVERSDIRLRFNPSAPIVVAMVPGPGHDVIRRMRRQAGRADSCARTFSIDLQHLIRV